MRRIRNVVTATLAMAGILLDVDRPSRRLLLAALLAVFLFNQWLMQVASSELAVVYFLVVFSNRYAFLFLSFIRNGIADRLIDRLGEEQGFEVYQCLTAIMFFQGASSVAILVSRTMWAGLPLPLQFHLLATGGGYLLSIAGFVINIWAIMVVGVDTYYYKDLFVGRMLGEFKREGPYKVFANPMYGPGQLGGYGSALLYGSLAGIIATLMNQAMMYLFFFTVERPHILRTLAASKSSLQQSRQAAGSSS